jgi:cbb3-type cytochrome oxidase subunit 3
MFKDVLQNIDGIEIFPIISLLIFFLFFISMLVWTFRLDKDFIKQSSRIPLSDSVDDLINGDINND